MKSHKFPALFAVMLFLLIALVSKQYGDDATFQNTSGENLLMRKPQELRLPECNEYSFVVVPIRVEKMIQIRLYQRFEYCSWRRRLSKIDCRKQIRR